MMMDKPIPVRLQLSRKKGARLVSPNGLPIVVVDRRSKWGNPFIALRGFTSDMAVDMFRSVLERDRVYFWTKHVTVDDIRRELKGKNLACWYDEGPCHADVLLRIANN